MGRIIMRKAGKMVVWVVSIVLAVVLLGVGGLALASPGKPAPFLDEYGRPLAGSISEKIFVTINGTRQGMFIRGKDVNNPVLLYLHGGMPDFFLTSKYPTGLEEIFTVVWWDQRGSGMSYQAADAGKTITLEDMITDTLELTDTLRERFGQEKIYLMGHSGGTFIGIQAAARSPERYHAYLGVAQVSNQLESELLAHEHMLAQFRAAGDERMVARLEAAPVTRTEGVSLAYQLLRDGAMHRLGIGTTHDMDSVVTGIFLPSWASPVYTLPEKLNLWRGKARSGIASLWSEMAATDLSQKVPELSIPVYFFEGIYDYTCNTTLARAYFDTLKAPVKGFYLFEHSAHSPIFEEPERVREIILEDVMRGENGLADGK